MSPRLKKLCQALPALLLIVVGPTAAMYVWSQIMADKRPYNPAVFEAFRRIEASCMAQDFEVRTVRCESVNRFAEGCYQSEDSCTAEEAYEHYAKLLFDLPPLKLERPL